MKPKDNAIHKDPQELQDPQRLFRRKLTLFGFLVMVYDRVDDRDKFSKKNLGLGRLHFHATSHLKIKAKLFFSQTLKSLCNSRISKSRIVTQIFFCMSHNVSFCRFL